MTPEKAERLRPQYAFFGLMLRILRDPWEVIDEWPEEPETAWSVDED